MNPSTYLKKQIAVCAFVVYGFNKEQQINQAALVVYFLIVEKFSNWLHVRTHQQNIQWGGGTAL